MGGAFMQSTTVDMRSRYQHGFGPGPRGNRACDGKNVTGYLESS